MKATTFLYSAFTETTEDSDMWKTQFNNESVNFFSHYFKYFHRRLFEYRRCRFAEQQKWGMCKNAGLDMLALFDVRFLLAQFREGLW